MKKLTCSIKQTDWIFAELAALTGPYFLVFLPATVGSLVVRISKPMMAPTFKIASFFTFLEVMHFVNSEY